MNWVDKLTNNMDNMSNILRNCDNEKGADFVEDITRNVRSAKSSMALECFLREASIADQDCSLIGGALFSALTRLMVSWDGAYGTGGSHANKVIRGFCSNGTLPLPIPNDWDAIVEYLSNQHA